MSRRLVLAVISNVFEVAVIAAAGLWGLPQLGVTIPVWAVFLIMLAWAVFSIFTYWLGSRALKSETPAGLDSMIGCQGEVIIALAPDGQVRIQGEIWKAESLSGELGEGRQIIVVSQNRLKLIVKSAD